MAAFGFSAGLPLPLSGATLRQWLTESGTSLEALGFTASLGLAYTLKFLWSPVLDHVRPPAGLARLGRRRGWLLAVQPTLMLAVLSLAASDPKTSPVLLVGSALAIAFLSATQDIVVDAWRVESFAPARQGAALAAYIWGYRAALLVAGAGALRLVHGLGWSGSIAVMAALLGIGMAAAGLAREPPARVVVVAPGLRARLQAAVIEPLRDFLLRPGAWPILAFVLLFKLGEALAHTMAVPFYNAMGFDRVAIADATGIPGLAASLAGAAGGAWLITRVGVGRALIATGFVQMASMGLYFALAVSHGEWWVLVSKITVENVAEGMADAAFITYLSSLCSARFTATQYALLSSLSAVGLRTVGALSGVFAAWLGWVWFYAMTIVAAVPAMLLMVWLLRRFPPEAPREATG